MEKITVKPVVNFADKRAVTQSDLQLIDSVVRIQPDESNESVYTTDEDWARAHKKSSMLWLGIAAVAALFLIGKK